MKVDTEQLPPRCIGYGVHCDDAMERVMMNMMEIMVGRDDKHMFIDRDVMLCSITFSLN